MITCTSLAKLYLFSQYNNLYVKILIIKKKRILAQKIKSTNITDKVISRTHLICDHILQLSKSWPFVALPRARFLGTFLEQEYLKWLFGTLFPYLFPFRNCENSILCHSIYSAVWGRKNRMRGMKKLSITWQEQNQQADQNNRASVATLNSNCHPEEENPRIVFSPFLERSFFSLVLCTSTSCHFHSVFSQEETKKPRPNVVILR